ncbi:RNA polymerase subunit sigma [Streptomyces canus]|uniref:RNA polymerase subunit sigma n=1 Tax=Streptomyces canus TaxID=58343 RepID=A0A101SI07_9ACTN|nr:RNA polymerase subunit sigma [Streptomyces canus]
MRSVRQVVPIAELTEERQHLLDVAYWMLGNGPGPENVVDEAYRLWYGLSDHELARIEQPRAWLVKTVGGICVARLAQPDREHSRTVGEPASERYEMLSQEIHQVMLNSLKSLSPTEQAALVLNDAFGTAQSTVADIGSQPECKQLTDHAHRSLQDRRTRPTTPQQHDAVTGAVHDACVAEEAGLLASLLVPDVTVYFDGGGKVRALVRPVHGRQQVARSLLTLLARHPRTRLDTHPVNGRTGLVVRYDRQVAGVISLDVAGPHVVQIWVTLNPDKLRSWNRSSAAR